MAMGVIMSDSYISINSVRSLIKKYIGKNPHDNNPFWQFKDEFERMVYNATKCANYPIEKNDEIT